MCKIIYVSCADYARHSMYAGHNKRLVLQRLYGVGTLVDNHARRGTRTKTNGKASHNGYIFQKLFSKRTIVQNRAYGVYLYKIDAMYEICLHHTECQCVIACTEHAVHICCRMAF